MGYIIHTFAPLLDSRLQVRIGHVCSASKAAGAIDGSAFAETGAFDQFGGDLINSLWFLGDWSCGGEDSADESGEDDGGMHCGSDVWGLRWNRMSD